MNVFITQQISARGLKRALLGTLSVTPLMLAILGSSAGSAFAQAAPAPVQTAQAAPAIETVVVTGSHIQRDGFEAPTPVTVTSAYQIQSLATNAAADYLNELPQFAGSTTPLSTAPGINNSQGSINGLALRGLGAIRTLTLVNGQRVVGDIATGIVDINQLPQQLIQRVDTVFGGASAVYGSDALTGVVNVILDTRYSGIKGELSAGQTNYGDDRSWKGNLTAGTDLFGGRGHIEVSGEAAGDQGILGLAGVQHRSWDQQGYQAMTNPAYGTGPGQSTTVPLQIAESQTGMSQASVGGLITAGPLKGTIFGPGGTISTITYGSLIDNPFMQGGSWQATNQRDNGLGVALDPRTTNQNAFARASYQVNDDIEVYIQGQWAHNHEESQSINNYELGSITIQSTNPFIPAPIVASMTADKITSFVMGTMNGDIAGTTPTYDRNVTRSLIGADGTFDAFGTSWKWDAHASYGYNRGYSAAVDTLEVNQYALALNAVRNPTTGQIVCADTLINPNDGCVPYNPFGTGVNSQAAVNYVTSLPGQANVTTKAGGISTGHFFHNYTIQTVQGFNVSGEPFSLWAGPISLATGFEHRKESLGATADPGEVAQAWFITSGTPYGGSYAINEGYLEADIPLADNASWAKNLDIDAAGRITGYSTFGVIETWKLGLNYTPPTLDGVLDGFRFRGTVSHDVREPTLVDYYSAPVSSNETVADPFLNNQTVSYFGYSEGNTNLVPESAITIGLGVVYQPSYIPNFSASFDYYDIDIHKAITSFSAQQELNLCYQNVASACAQVATVGTQNGLPILQITTAPLNFATEKATGFDIASNYLLPLDNLYESWPGALNFQVHITHAMSDVQNSGAPGTIPIDVVGENASAFAPHWKYQISTNYVSDPIVVGLTMRGLSQGKYNTNWITCTTACPVSTANNITSNYNTLPSAWYFDLSSSYTVSTGVNMYFNVKNLFNLNPPIYYSGPSGNAWQTIPAPLYNYDILGRVYRLGVRFDM